MAGVNGDRSGRRVQNTQRHETSRRLRDFLAADSAGSWFLVPGATALAKYPHTGFSRLLNFPES